MRFTESSVCFFVLCQLEMEALVEQEAWKLLIRTRNGSLCKWWIPGLSGLFTTAMFDQRRTTTLEGDITLLKILYFHPHPYCRTFPQIQSFRNNNPLRMLGCVQQGFAHCAPEPHTSNQQVQLQRPTYHLWDSLQLTRRQVAAAYTLLEVHSRICLCNSQFLH